MNFKYGASDSGGHGGLGTRRGEVRNEGSEIAELPCHLLWRWEWYLMLSEPGLMKNKWCTCTYVCVCPLPVHRRPKPGRVQFWRGSSLTQGQAFFVPLIRLKLPSSLVDGKDLLLPLLPEFVGDIVFSGKVIMNIFCIFIYTLFIWPTLCKRNIIIRNSVLLYRNKILKTLERHAFQQANSLEN